MHRAIRTVLTFGTVTGGTVVFGSAAAASGMVGRRDWSDKAAVAWSRMLLGSIGVEIEARGIEHAAGLGPCVVASSHRSHLDGPVLLCTLPFRFAFVIKRSLARIPFFGWGVTQAGYVPIDRADRADSVAGMRRAAAMVRNGRRVLVFPEGTRSETGEFLPFKKGGVVLAIEAQVPILPVAVVGTRELLPSGTLAPRPGRVVVRIGPPIATDGMTYADRDVLLSRVEAEVHRLYAEG